LLKDHVMTRDLKYLTLGVGFLTALLVFSMAAATGAIIIIALPALAQTDGGGNSSSIGGGGSAGGSDSGSDGITTITNAQMHLAQAMTALQNKNTTGAMMQLNLLNQSLTRLSTGAGGITLGGIPGPGPSGGPGAGSSGAGNSGGGASIYSPPDSSHSRSGGSLRGGP
jgi:hypothetical protein